MNDNTPLLVVTVNGPGYMPVSEPSEYQGLFAARLGLIAELEETSTKEEVTDDDLGMAILLAERAEVEESIYLGGLAHTIQKGD